MSKKAATSLALAGVRPRNAARQPLPHTSTQNALPSSSCSKPGRAGYATRRGPSTTTPPRYNFNTSMSWDAEPDPEHPRYRRVTARDLKHRSEPPTRVKMLVRDFIDDSLYNPQYGYFSKQAQIFSPSPASSSSSTSSSPTKGFDIPSFPNLTAFQEHVAEAYEREYSVSASRELDGSTSPSTSKARSKSKTITTESTIAEQGNSTDAIARAVELEISKGEGWSSKDLGGRGGEVIAGGLGRQVWHTPTELFKPFYSRIVARSLISHYLLHSYPTSPFNIYELGAGNGSLMIDILTFLKEDYPEVFAKTRYTIVEISEALAARQRGRAREAGFLVEEDGDEAQGVTDEMGKVRVINKDWFEWEGGGEESCYLVALEVFDNFAHDMIRYDLRTMDPLQAIVCIDSHGDFSLLYEPITDPIIRRYLAYRKLLHTSTQASIFTSNSVSPPINPFLLSSPLLRKMYTSLPFAPNLSSPEFLPTKQMIFLESLRDKLPFHRLLVADFDSLPDTVEGRNGPVVQTRYGGSMVPCETFLVKQGYFDIFFPTDFELLRDMYASIMTSSSSRLPRTFFSQTNAHLKSPAESERSASAAGSLATKAFKHQKVSVWTHADFLTEFGSQQEIEGSQTKDGGNVMLGMYKNAKFLF